MKILLKTVLCVLMACMITACAVTEKKPPAPPQNKHWVGFKQMLQRNVLNTDNMIKSYVDEKCHAKINDYRIWRIFSMVLSDKKKYHYEQKVCDCATEEALKQVTPNDLINMAKSSTREKTLETLTTNVTKACIKRMI